MSSPSNVSDSPITGKAQLVEYVASGEKPKDDWRIGTEHEKFGFRLDDLRPPTFDGDRGIIKSYVDPNTMLDGQFDFPLRGQVLGTLLRRVPGLRLATDTPEWDRNIVLRGPKTLPVCF